MDNETVIITRQRNQQRNPHNQHNKSQITEQRENNSDDKELRNKNEFQSKPITKTKNIIEVQK